MLTFLTYALTFAAGGLTSELWRIAQERRALRYITRIVVGQAKSPETVLSCWSADPHNWCNKPGCPRCWDGWGRS